MMDPQFLCDVAQAFLTAVSGTASPLLSELPETDQHRWIGIATMALRSQNSAVVDLATWRAAEAVAVERYGCIFERLNQTQQRECRLLASTACIAYTCHLKGLTDPVSEQRTRRMVDRITAQITARHSQQQETEPSDSHQPDPSFAVGFAAARASVRPFLRAKAQE